jgi:putative ATP-dependent endonuclease of the OLD family
MRVRQLTIHNFRGVRHGVVDFPKNALLVGGNNSGKSTVCEALDLVLGPERQFRRPVVDEHDFHCGHYLADQPHLPYGLEEGSEEWAAAHAEGVRVAEEAATIRIHAVLVDLSPEAERRFQGNLRKWDDARSVFIDEGEGVRPEDADEPDRPWALELVFIGRYNADEDDFEGTTFFAHPVGPVP